MSTLWLFYKQVKLICGAVSEVGRLIILVEVWGKCLKRGLKGPSRVLVMFCFMFWILVSWVCSLCENSPSLYIFLYSCSSKKSIQKELVILENPPQNSLLTLEVCIENKLNMLTLYLRIYGFRIIGLSKCHCVTGAVTVLLVL